MEYAFFISDTHAGLAVLAVMEFLAILAIAQLRARIRGLRKYRQKLYEAFLMPVEDDLKQMEIQMAVMAQRMESVDHRLSSLEDNVKRLVWLIITAMVGGFMTFIIGGGLVVG